MEPNYIVTEIPASEFEHVVLETRAPLRVVTVRPERDRANERLMRDVLSTPYAITYA